MALNLYKHFVYGTLSKPQVDSNWTDIESEVNGLSGRLPLNNYAATSDPTVNDDVTQGYSAGSMWYNRSNNQIFLLVSANSGAAHWVEYTAVSPPPVDSFGVVRSDVAAMVASIDLRIGITVRTLEHTSGYGYEGGNLYKIVAGGTGTADNGSYIDLDNGLQAMGLFPNGAHGKQFGVNPNLATEVDDAFSAMCARFEGTGVAVRLSKGLYRIAQSHTIDGFTLDLSDGAEVCVQGEDALAFLDGGLNVVSRGVILGGVVFTSGDMQSGFDGTSAIHLNGGTIKGFTKVYSQLYAAVRMRDPKDCEVEVFGGRNRGFELITSIDSPASMNIRYHNTGVLYADKLVASTTVNDSRAVELRASATISSRWSVHAEGHYSAKNGLWVQTSDPSNTINNLYLTGRITKPGRFLDANGDEQLGHGAGTCVEVLSCPGAVIDMQTEDPRGYNVAVAQGSHGAKVVGGFHRGAGDDPNIVVANSNDVIVSSRTVRGTVGVSVGEDGATANNCKILNHVFENCTSPPVRFTSGNLLTILNCTFSGEPTRSGDVGNWVGSGKVRPVVRVFSEANDVIFRGNEVSGWFTHDVISYGHTGKLRVSRGGNEYNAPMLPRNDISFGPLHHALEGGEPLIHVLNSEDSGGYAGVGEISIPAESTNQYASHFLNPQLTNVLGLAGDDENIDDVLLSYAVLVYMKYVPDANGKQVRFGISSTLNTSHTGSTFFGEFTNASEPDNSISGKLHPLEDGEWIPIVISLRSLIYSGADKSNLTRFMVYKYNDGDTYDLTITKPVLFYLGATPR